MIDPIKYHSYNICWKSFNCMSLTFVECTDCWTVQRGTYDSMYDCIYSHSQENLQFVTKPYYHVLKGPKITMVTLQISKMYSVSPHQAHSLKRLIFNECSITFVFFFKIHALMNNTVLSLCSKCISMQKKGKDVVHIFTKIPRGIKLVLKFMYRYI